MAVDKPVVHASLSDLDNEVAQEAFVFALKGNKRITFPAPQDMSFTDAEAFMNAIQGENTNISEMLKNWLSEEDYQKLADANLTLGQVTQVVKLATKHYEGVFGDAGN